MFIQKDASLTNKKISIQLLAYSIFLRCIIALIINGRDTNFHVFSCIISKMAILPAVSYKKLH